MSSLSQGSPQVSWLDEELRKEKAVVVELRERIDKQNVVMADQAQRILSLEDRLAKLQNQLLRIPELQEALVHAREELGLKMAELRQEQQNRATEFLRNRQTEREQEMRAIQAIEAELSRFEPLEQAMPVREAEERRLNEALMRLQQEVQAIAPHLVRGEDGRRQLTERIERNVVKVGQVEQTLEEFRKAHQAFLGRVLILENALPKYEERIAELQNVRQEVSAKEDELLENQRRAEVERSQVMAEWGRKLEASAHQLEVWSDQLRYFTDQHEKNRRVLRDIQEMAQQVSQQQDQLRQLQRIAEEQLRREFREWRSETDRRLVQEITARKHALEEQAKREDEQDKRITEMENKRPEDLAKVAGLQDRMNEVQRDMAAQLNTLRQALVRVVRVQEKVFQDGLAELRGFLGEV